MMPIGYEDDSRQVFALGPKSFLQEGARQVRLSGGVEGELLWLTDGRDGFCQ